MTPARAGPATEPLVSVASATLPKISIPDLIDPQGSPTLAQPQSATPSEPVQDSPERPSAKSTGDLATLVASMRSSEPGSRELECLAVGVYFESKGEPLAGQLAVGQVIANRAGSGRFPSSYCGVLFQRGQFSFVRGRSLPAVPRASRNWQTAVAIAKIVDQDLKDSAVGNALFFHARYVSPRWKLKRVAAIGNHIFYR
jgi:spore germination cell wall hydrolase CwlJ-like protein